MTIVIDVVSVDIWVFSVESVLIPTFTGQVRESCVVMKFVSRERESVFIYDMSKNVCEIRVCIMHVCVFVMKTE